MPVPAALRDGLGATAEGAAWIGRLPGLVEAAAGRWDLELGEPFTQGSCSWAAPARPRSGPWVGRDLVLKVTFPHDEAAAEADGLRLWHGRGAVQLVDAAGWDLLLARVAPGTPLTEDPRGDALRLEAGATALRSLHDAGRSAAGSGPFPVMADVCAGWADQMRERLAAAVGAECPVQWDVGLVDGAARLLTELSVVPAGLPEGRGHVVVHGDANPGNLLRVGSGWLWINPKPMSGDGAYDPWPLLEQVGAPLAAADPVAELRWRTDLVADVLGLDAARIAAWAWARSAESALWAWSWARDVEGASGYLARAKAWAALVR